MRSTNVTFSGNSAANDGGGMAASDGVLVEACVLTGNQADRGGGNPPDVPSSIN